MAEFPYLYKEGIVGQFNVFLGVRCNIWTMGELHAKKQKYFMKNRSHHFPYPWGNKIISNSRNIPIWLPLE